MDLECTFYVELQPSNPTRIPMPSESNVVIPAMKTPTTNTHPPAIIFDFGGVLLDWNPRYLYRKLFPNNEQGMEHFLAEIGFDEWNHLQNAGRPFSVAIAELSARYPQYCDLIRAYDERYLESLKGAIPGTVNILCSLCTVGFPLIGFRN